MGLTSKTDLPSCGQTIFYILILFLISDRTQQISEGGLAPAIPTQRHCAKEGRWGNIDSSARLVLVTGQFLAPRTNAPVWAPHFFHVWSLAGLEYRPSVVAVPFSFHVNLNIISFFGEALG